jgi:hypothetical protein
VIIKAIVFANQVQAPSTHGVVENLSVNRGGRGEDEYSDNKQHTLKRLHKTRANVTHRRDAQAATRRRAEGRKERWALPRTATPQKEWKEVRREEIHLA